MNSTPYIYIIEDEESISKLISLYLNKEEMKSKAFFNAEDALSSIQNEKDNMPDLIILDLMMPKKDGLAACQEIRMFSTVPIIMLTARSEDSDLLMGFESGADDYITKPFKILELKARVRALLRRAGISSSTQTGNEGSAIEMSKGALKVDTERRSVLKDGVPVDLTLKEFDLLAFLMKNAGRIYSRDKLLELVWDYDYMGDTRTVDVHIRRLREKIERDPAAPEYIITKWGVGYYFAE